MNKKFMYYNLFYLALNSIGCFGILKFIEYDKNQKKVSK